MSSYAPCRFGCVAERKLISPTKLKTISTFCTRFPSTFSGAWTMIFLINSLTIAGVSSFIPTYLRIIAAKLSKSLHGYCGKQPVVPLLSESAFSASLFRKGENWNNSEARMIATKANVGIGLINYHFGSKEKLITKCVQRIIEKVVKKFHMIKQYETDKERLTACATYVCIYSYCCNADGIFRKRNNKTIIWI